MNPIYFPFTFVAASRARDLSGFLGPVTMLQPVSGYGAELFAPLPKNGWIRSMAPETGDDSRIIAAFREFKEWGGRHHGAEKSLKAAFDAGFYQQNFVSQIRSDILKVDDAASGSAGSGPPDPLFLARLFLLMAQDFDARRGEVELDLALSGRREKEMFRRMTGRDAAQTKGPDGGPDAGLETLAELPDGGDPGAYLTAQRLAAWFRVMESVPADGPFLVTDSPAVAALMPERAGEMVKIRTFSHISRHQPESARRDFYQRLAHLAETPWPEEAEAAKLSLESGNDPRCGLDLYLAPGRGPEAFGRSFFNSSEKIKNNKTKWLNTIIGVFKPA